MEPVVRPYRWKDLSWPTQRLFKRLRDPVKGKQLILEKNYLVEKIIPRFTVRRITPAEMEHYRAPFPDAESRKPLWAWPAQMPLDGTPANTHQSLSEIYEFLKTTELPKLLLWAKPGTIIRKKDAMQLKKEWLNLQTLEVGRGRHYLPEDQPHSIGTALARWIKQQNSVVEDSRYDLNPESSCMQK